jgi:hypothetical protein
LSGKERGAPPLGLNPLHSGLAPATDYFETARPQPQTFPSQYTEAETGAGADVGGDPWSSAAKAEEGAEAEAEGEGGEEEEEVEEDRARGLRGFFTKHVLQWLPGVEALGVGSPIDLRQIGETSAPPKRASAFT